MPGERVETFHISQIDKSKCLGYRNIIIHCEINDIQDHSPGRQMFGTILSVTFWSLNRSLILLNIKKTKSV